MTWSLSQEQRQETVGRVAANLFTIAFTKGFPITDEVALDAASTFERRAYTAAAVASNVTTGSRPEAETTLGYARCVCLSVYMGHGCMAVQHWLRDGQMH